MNRFLVSWHSRYSRAKAIQTTHQPGEATGPAEDQDVNLSAPKMLGDCSYVSRAGGCFSRLGINNRGGSRPGTNKLLTGPCRLSRAIEVYLLVLVHRLNITRKWPELLKDLPDSSPHLSNEALGAFRLLGWELLHVAVPLFLRLCQSTLHVLTVSELQASSQHLASRSMKEPVRVEDKTCTMPSTNTWSHRWPSPHHGSPQLQSKNDAKTHAKASRYPFRCAENLAVQENIFGIPRYPIRGAEMTETLAKLRTFQLFSAVFQHVPSLFWFSRLFSLHKLHPLLS